MAHRAKHSWLRNHSLSLVIAAILLVLLALYWRSDPGTRLGALYGNSIADWLGSLVLVVATKFWYEKGSVESRLPPHWRKRGPDWLRDHSLTILLLITWTAWIAWYVRLDANGKTGQVVGNVVSEWGQVLGLIWFTKYLYERGSKESR
jgi:hypothetical protein